MSGFESFWRRILREMREFEEDVERMFEELAEALTSPPSRPMWSTDGTLEPLVQVVEEDDRYIITVDLPYGDMRNLSITGEEDKIHISCRLKRNVKFERWGTVQRETEFREYRKTILLPEDADVSGFTVYKREDKCMIKIVVPKKRPYR